jgi:integrase
MTLPMPAARRNRVRPIKFHNLPHTCATLLLQAGQPVHVVSERLGHSKVSMSMEVYAHVLPDMQQVQPPAWRAIARIRATTYTLSATLGLG